MLFQFHILHKMYFKNGRPSIHLYFAQKFVVVSDFKRYIYFLQYYFKLCSVRNIKFKKKEYTYRMKVAKILNDWMTQRFTNNIYNISKIIFLRSLLQKFYIPKCWCHCDTWGLRLISIHNIGWFKRDTAIVNGYHYLIDKNLSIRFTQNVKKEVQKFISHFINILCHSPWSYGQHISFSSFHALYYAHIWNHNANA